MKKVFTLLVAAMATVSGMAQMGGAMKFAGKAGFYVSSGNTQMGNTTIESDTIVYEGSDITLPSMVYGTMVIPSFTIRNTQYEGGYAGVTWQDQKWNATAVDASGTEKAITGTSLTGSFTHDDGIYKLTLSATFNYGPMPMPITYHVEGYYVKTTTEKISVLVGGKFGPYTNDKVSFDARIYQEDGEKKLDVAMHDYSLSGTVMGDLIIGGYTVKGLVYDESKGGYYRDYAADGLKMHFTAAQDGVVTMDSDYILSSGNQNLLVKMDGASITYALNNFQPGAMPFPISATFGTDSTTGINTVSTNAEEKIVKRIENGRIVIEKNGRKYNTSGVLIR